MKPGNLREHKFVCKVLNPAVVYRKMRVYPNVTLRRSAERFFTPKNRKEKNDHGKKTFYIRFRH